MNIDKLTSDDILEVANEIISTPARAERRDEAMRCNQAKGLDVCEICGKAVKIGKGIKLTNGCLIGSTCIKKVRKIIINW